MCIWQYIWQCLKTKGSGKGLWKKYSDIGLLGVVNADCFSLYGKYDYLN